MRSRKKKRMKPVLIMLLLAVFCAAGGALLYRRYGPSTERMSLEALYGVSGNRTAIMYQYELQKAFAICEDGEAYLPVEWVQSILNKRFYWDADEALLLYTLPEETVRMNPGSRSEGGRTLFLEEKDKLWLSAELVEQYTDVRIERFLDGSVKRIFISLPEEADRVAGVRGKTSLRSRPSIKGSIVTEVGGKETLRIIPDHPGAMTDAETWQRVMTDDGFTGYVRVKKLYAENKAPYAHTFEAPQYASGKTEGSVMMGWHQLTTEAANRKMSSVLKRTKGLTVISPTWFSLRGNEGDYKSLADRAYVEEAHRMGLKVWALIDNFDDSVTLGVMLKKTSVRERLIKKLMEDADRYGFDGINIDFELLRKDAVKQYLQFIRELSVACRKRGICLSVDVPNPASYNLHYDRKELAVFCDYVINMGYDEHTNGDRMGSTSSLPFFQSGLDESLKEVPAEKLIAGIPFYTRIWRRERDGQESSEIVTMRGAAEWVDKNRVLLNWDSEEGQYRGEQTADDGSTRYIWMEDEQSIALKTDAVRLRSLSGIACWKLGIEKEEVWEILNHEKLTE